MPIDPAQGFALTPEGHQAEKMADLERRLRALETGAAVVQAGAANPTLNVRDGVLYAQDDGLGTRRLWVRVGGAWRSVIVS